jgi:hypothetical protein
MKASKAMVAAVAAAGCVAVTSAQAQVSKDMADRCTR